MKRQYLVYSKDSFKSDSHDYLVETLAYSHLKIAWTMTVEPMERTRRSIFRDQHNGARDNRNHY